MHTPVFLPQVLEALNVREDGLYIDATAGEGGHLLHIAKKAARVLGIDYDREQIDRLAARGLPANVTLVHGNFRDIARIARQHGMADVDGVVLDLGLSYRQLREKGIGLSYQNPNEPLSMQICDTAGLKAADLLNKMDTAELTRVFVKNAEEPLAAQIAAKIADRREKLPFSTVGDLLEVIHDSAGRNREDWRNIAARVFQALRMEVNDEMKNLETATREAVSILKPGGRLVIVTFHSLEDRSVKLFGLSEQHLKPIRYRVFGSKRAKFERSARLRVFEKLA